MADVGELSSEERGDLRKRPRILDELGVAVMVVINGCPRNDGNVEARSLSVPVPVPGPRSHSSCTAFYFLARLAIQFSSSVI